jgi:hypothetical protein
MTSEEFSKAVVHQLQSLENRILGVGRDQYDLGGKQKIELKTIGEVLDDSLEEIDDLLVYLSYTRIRIQKLRANLDLELLESQSPLATD